MKSALKRLLGHAFVTELSRGPFTAAGLSERAGMSYGHISRRVSSLLERGLLRETRPRIIRGTPGRSGLRGFEPARHSLTARGRRLIRVVLCGGAFDILHPGHLSFLREAGSHGDVLVVAVAMDSTVEGRKGRSPVFSQAERLELLSSLSMVDLAIPGTRDYFRTLRKVSPDLVFLGHDQHQDLRMVRSCARGAGRPGIMVSERELEGHSTSAVMRKIKAR